jgi:NAD(P)H-hydrate epimerase
MQYLSAQEAAELDKTLMSDSVGFELAQLMELAGLSVAQAAHTMLQDRMDKTPAKVLVICGPGNNGGDGLVAARHLQQLGHDAQVWYPKQKTGIYEGLVKQLRHLTMPVHTDSEHPPEAFDSFDLIVDAIFGFSFSGGVRAPFDAIIKALSDTKTPMLSVDVPSSWDLKAGQPKSGTGSRFSPAALISLSAPKTFAAGFQGRHFLGGRFLSPKLQAQYGLPAYRGLDQVIELGKL